MRHKKFFDSWTEALESGEYRQTRGTLRKGKSKFAYCCLGVACEVANQTGLMKVDITKEKENGVEVLPERLAKKLNLTTGGAFKEPVTHRGRRYYTLVQLNDEARANFKTIARIIREQLVAGNFEPYPN